MDLSAGPGAWRNPASMDDYGYGGSPGENFGAFVSEKAEDRSKSKKPTGSSSEYNGSEINVGSGSFGSNLPDASSGRDFLESLFSNVNYDLLVSKTFYFFFFAAFGSLFPLIAVYFKQLGMNPAQTGVLIGFRPFVEFVSGPFWSNIADRWKKWKAILLFSLFCWVAFTLSLAFVQPPPNSCLVHNGTAIIVVKPWMANNNRNKRDLETLTYGSYSTMDKENRFGDLGEHESLRNEQLSPDGTDSDGDKEDTEETKQFTQADTKSITTKGDVQPSQSTTPYNYFAEGRTVRYLPHPSIDAYGKSPLPLDHKDIANLNEINAEGLVSPPLSAVVYKSVEIQKIFLILLMLMIIGEFLSAPATELADAATLGYLGDDMESYGRQRLFGSFGWALAMFFVGIALDHSNVFPNHPCGNEQLVDRNYIVCFAVFSVLMSCAFIAATQFRFKEDVDGDGGIQLSDFKEKVLDKVQAKIIKIKKPDRHSMMSSDDETPDYGYDQHKTGSGVPGLRDGTQAAPGTDDPNNRLHISLQDGAGLTQGGGNMISDTTAKSDPPIKPSPFIPRGRPGQSGRLPQWISVLKLYGNVKHGAAFFVLWFMGFGVGLVFAFLFWHLQDMHGTPTLFGLASVINHISEVLSYFFAKRLISKIGHVKVLYIGMLGNILRYLYISWLRNPWWVLPFEFLQGLTHATVWAAGCSYLTMTIPAPLRPTATGIVMAVHHGLGRAMGTIIAGGLVHRFGTEFTFRGYGIATIVILAGYVALNYFYISKYMPGDDNEYEETSALAPHGVPMSISRSRSNMDDMGNNSQQYGAAGQGSSSGNFLNPGNAPKSTGYGGSTDNGQRGGYQRGGGGGGGGGGGDGGYSGDDNPYHYGYSYEVEDPKKLDLRSAQPPQRKMGDSESIRAGFKAYDEATMYRDTAAQKPIREALILSHSPRPITELSMPQPRPVYANDMNCY